MGRFKKPRTTPPPPPVEGATWIPLTQGRFALVDDADVALVSTRTWSWSGEQTRYAVSRKGGVNTYLHIFLMGRRPGFVVDHRNRDRMDHRRQNLRWLTSVGNVANSVPKHGSKTGYRGVSPTKRGGKFMAKVANRYIGAFQTADEAARAYDLAARDAYGEAAVLNFPEAS